MTEAPSRITLDEWGRRYAELTASGLREPDYGGPLDRHLEAGDRRLRDILFDNSAASLRLWNFLLTEEDRLRRARDDGAVLVGAMKDLGTVPVLAFSLPDTVAFYPDGAWWIPCVMCGSEHVLAVADRLGIDESFCPVRAMLGAFVSGEHFPLPDLITCSVGATCDDFSAVAQRLEGLGHEILWWEIPHRRHPDPGEPAVDLPGGFRAARSQVDFVRGELARVRQGIESARGARLEAEDLAIGIRAANAVRRRLAALRDAVFRADPCPLPALEMLIAEMLALHFCSDREEALSVLGDLLAEVRERTDRGRGVLPAGAARVFWVNPVADLRAMNLLENCGGRVCGTEYLFSHALDEIPEDIPPDEALARMALADPMIGTVRDRAERICRDARQFGAEAVVISRIPGASHCAAEGEIIAEAVRAALGLPVIEFEVPSVSDAFEPALRTRLEALVETVRERRCP